LIEIYYSLGPWGDIKRVLEDIIRGKVKFTLDYFEEHLFSIIIIAAVALVVVVILMDLVVTLVSRVIGRLRDREGDKSFWGRR
jgi:hypothetical protein